MITPAVAKRKKRQTDWLVAVVTAVGAALLTSLFTLWFVNKQVISAHTTLVFEKRLNAHEQLLFAMTKGEMRGCGNQKSEFSRSKVYEAIMSAETEIQGFTSSGFDDFGEMLANLREIDSLRDKYSFYISPDLEQQINRYLLARANWIQHFKGPGTEETLARQMDTEYCNTIALLQKNIGLNQLPF